MVLIESDDVEETRGSRLYALEIIPTAGNEQGATNGPHGMRDGNVIIVYDTCAR